MALQTPVVVSVLDGTFTNKRISTGGKRCSEKDKHCMASEINNLLTNERDWNEAAAAAPKFVSKNFGSGRYMRDWVSILEKVQVEQRKIQIVLDGNAKFNGESMEAQNWHIAKMLSESTSKSVSSDGQEHELQFDVSVIGSVLEPPIQGVKLAKPVKMLNNEGEFVSISPFPTGYQANMVIRQKWPPNNDIIPITICSFGCHVAQILPWEFGFLPLIWMAHLLDNIDWLWAPSEYNRDIYTRSGYPFDRTALLPAGVDCASLLSDGKSARENRSSNASKSNISTDLDTVTFIFSGGFLPRKGVDILLEEWHGVFCSFEDSFVKEAYIKSNAKLIVHTSYELGYSKAEVDKMKEYIDSCDGKIEWKRNVWMERTEYIQMIKRSDIYLAPFRSEGFGLPIVEALALGLKSIVSVGGTAADDYMNADVGQTDHWNREMTQLTYPIQATEDLCKHPPCFGEKLCVFSPCKNMRCACEKLVETPLWFEPSRTDLQKQMKKAYNDVLEEREMNTKNSPYMTKTIDDLIVKQFCWEDLRIVYHEKVLNTLSRSTLRKIQTFKIPSQNEQSTFWLYESFLESWVDWFKPEIVFFLVVLFFVLVLFVSKHVFCILLPLSKMLHTRNRDCMITRLKNVVRNMLTRPGKSRKCK